MGSKTAIQILLSLNLLFFTFTVVSSTCVPCSAPPKGHKSPCSTPPKGHKSPPPVPCSTPPKCHKSPCSTPPKRHKCPPPVPQPQPQPPSTGTKPPQPPSTGTKQPSCPKDTLKLGVCADLLGLVNVQLGKNTPCCSLIQGLADLDAAVCLCTALKANVLGINLNIPINLALLLNLCGKNVPKGFVCG